MILLAVSEGAILMGVSQHQNNLVGKEHYYIPVNGNTALQSSHRGCSKDKIRPSLVLRPSTKLPLSLKRQF